MNFFLWKWRNQFQVPRLMDQLYQPRYRNPQIPGLESPKWWSEDWVFHENSKSSSCSATAESILLYGSECWAMTASLQKSLYGSYTRKWMSTCWITSPVTISTETSPGFQTKLHGGDLGLRVTVRETKSFPRTTSFSRNESQPTARAVHTNQLKLSWTLW